MPFCHVDQLCCSSSQRWDLWLMKKSDLLSGWCVWVMRQEQGWSHTGVIFIYQSIRPQLKTDSLTQVHTVCGCVESYCRCEVPKEKLEEVFHCGCCP